MIDARMNDVSCGPRAQTARLNKHAQHTHTNSHKSPQDQHHQIESNRKRARAARTSSQRFTNQAMLILYILDFRRAQAYFSTNNITEDTLYKAQRMTTLTSTI